MPENEDASRRPARELEPPPMDHEAGWKESAFTPEMGALILARIAEGETVRQITADPRMPAYATVYRWTHVVPEFGDAWRALRARMAARRRALDWVRAEEAVQLRAVLREIAGKPPRDWVAGKKSTYTPEWGEAVCQAIAAGAALSEVTARPDMPSAKAVYRWMRRFPAFREAYAAACDWREEMLRDQIWDLASRAEPFGLAIVRPQAERMLGRIGRTRPRKYGPAT